MCCWRKVSIGPLQTQIKASQVYNNTVIIYSQNCIERSPLGQRKSGHERQMTSKSKDWKANEFKVLETIKPKSDFVDISQRVRSKETTLHVTC